MLLHRIEQTFGVCGVHIKGGRGIIIKGSTIESKARMEVFFGLLVGSMGRIGRVLRSTSRNPGMK